MLTVAGILLWTMLAIAWLCRVLKRQTYGLSVMQIAGAFSFKIIMGCAYGYIFLTMYEGDDTWWLHEYSLGQQQLLLDDPLRFFAELGPFASPRAYDSWADHLYYYLGDIEVWILTKPMALINFLTAGNYYMNLVFFNVPVFIAQSWLYRLVTERTSGGRTPIFLAVFFVPPVIFWLSGFRPDGLLFFFVMLGILQFSALMQKKDTGRIVAFIIGMAGILVFRSYLLALMIPSFVAWFMVEKRGRKPLPAFAGVYGLCVLLFFATTWISPSRNAATVISARQAAFFALEGNTRFALDTLKPNLPGFVKVLPQALNNSFLRPYPWEAKGFLQLAASVEVLLLLLLVILFSFRPMRNGWVAFCQPLFLTLLFFALFQFLIIGYTVPFPGAIVRYKIIGELFLFAMFAGLINWKFFLKRSD